MTATLHQGTNYNYEGHAIIQLLKYWILHWQKICGNCLYWVKIVPSKGSPSEWGYYVSPDMGLMLISVDCILCFKAGKCADESHTINEPYHLMASRPTLWLTEKALAKCHGQAECTCEIIGGKWLIHKWIGQSLLLLIPRGLLKTLSQISNTTLIFEYRKHLGRSSNIMIRTVQEM